MSNTHPTTSINGKYYDSPHPRIRRTKTINSLTARSVLLILLLFLGLYFTFSFVGEVTLTAISRSSFLTFAEAQNVPKTQKLFLRTFPFMPPMPDCALPAIAIPSRQVPGSVGRSFEVLEEAQNVDLPLSSECPTYCPHVEGTGTVCTFTNIVGNTLSKPAYLEALGAKSDIVFPQQRNMQEMAQNGEGEGASLYPSVFDFSMVPDEVSVLNFTGVMNVEFRLSGKWPPNLRQIHILEGVLLPINLPFLHPHVIMSLAHDTHNITHAVFCGARLRAAQIIRPAAFASFGSTASSQGGIVLPITNGLTVVLDMSEQDVLQANALSLFLCPTTGIPPSLPATPLLPIRAPFPTATTAHSSVFAANVTVHQGTVSFSAVSDPLIQASYIFQDIANVDGPSYSRTYSNIFINETANSFSLKANTYSVDYVGIIDFSFLRGWTTPIPMAFPELTISIDYTNIKLRLQTYGCEQMQLARQLTISAVDQNFDDLSGLTVADYETYALGGHNRMQSDRVKTFPLGAPEDTRVAINRIAALNPTRPRGIVIKPQQSCLVPGSSVPLLKIKSDSQSVPDGDGYSWAVVDRYFDVNRTLFSESQAPSPNTVFRISIQTQPISPYFFLSPPYSTKFGSSLLSDGFAQVYFSPACNGCAPPRSLIAPCDGGYQNVSGTLRYLTTTIAVPSRDAVSGTITQPDYYTTIPNSFMYLTHGVRGLVKSSVSLGSSLCDFVLGKCISGACDAARQADLPDTFVLADGELMVLIRGQTFSPIMTRLPSYNSKARTWIIGFISDEIGWRLYNALQYPTEPLVDEFESGDASCQPTVDKPILKIFRVDPPVDDAYQRNALSILLFIVTVDGNVHFRLNESREQPCIYPYTTAPLTLVAADMPPSGDLLIMADAKGFTGLSFKASLFTRVSILSFDYFNVGNITECNRATFPHPQEVCNVTNLFTPGSGSTGAGTVVYFIDSFAYLRRVGATEGNIETIAQAPADCKFRKVLPWGGHAAFNGEVAVVCEGSADARILVYDTSALLRVADNTTSYALPFWTIALGSKAGIDFDSFAFDGNLVGNLRWFTVAREQGDTNRYWYVPYRLGVAPMDLRPDTAATNAPSTCKVTDAQQTIGYLTSDSADAAFQPYFSGDTPSHMTFMSTHSDPYTGATSGVSVKQIQSTNPLQPDEPPQPSKWVHHTADGDELTPFEIPCESSVSASLRDGLLFAACQELAPNQALGVPVGSLKIVNAQHAQLAGQPITTLVHTPRLSESLEFAGVNIHRFTGFAVTSLVFAGRAARESAGPGTDIYAYRNRTHVMYTSATSHTSNTHMGSQSEYPLPPGGPASYAFHGSIGVVMESINSDVTFIYGSVRTRVTKNTLIPSYGTSRQIAIDYQEYAYMPSYLLLMQDSNFIWFVDGALDMLMMDVFNLVSVNDLAIQQYRAAMVFNGSGLSGDPTVVPPYKIRVSPTIIEAFTRSPNGDSSVSFTNGMKKAELLCSFPSANASTIVGSNVGLMCGKPSDTISMSGGTDRPIRPQQILQFAFNQYGAVVADTVVVSYFQKDSQQAKDVGAGPAAVDTRILIGATADAFYLFVNLSVYVISPEGDSTTLMPDLTAASLVSAKVKHQVAVVSRTQVISVYESSSLMLHDLETGLGTPYPLPFELIATGVAVYPADSDADDDSQLASRIVVLALPSYGSSRPSLQVYSLPASDDGKVTSIDVDHPLEIVIDDDPSDNTSLTQLLNSKMLSCSGDEYYGEAICYSVFLSVVVPEPSALFAKKPSVVLSFLSPAPGDVVTRILSIGTGLPMYNITVPTHTQAAVPLARAAALLTTKGLTYPLTVDIPETVTGDLMINLGFKYDESLIWIHHSGQPCYGYQHSLPLIEILSLPMVTLQCHLPSLSLGTTGPATYCSTNPATMPSCRSVVLATEFQATETLSALNWVSMVAFGSQGSLVRRLYCRMGGVYVEFRDGSEALVASATQQGPIYQCVCLRHFDAESLVVSDTFGAVLSTVNGLVKVQYQFHIGHYPQLNQTMADVVLRNYTEGLLESSAKSCFISGQGTMTTLRPDPSNNCELHTMGTELTTPLPEGLPCGALRPGKFVLPNMGDANDLLYIDIVSKKLLPATWQAVFSGNVTSIGIVENSPNSSTMWLMPEANAENGWSPTVLLFPDFKSASFLPTASIKTHLKPDSTSEAVLSVVDTTTPEFLSTSASLLAEVTVAKRSYSLVFANLQYATNVRGSCQQCLVVDRTATEFFVPLREDVSETSNWLQVTSEIRTSLDSFVGDTQKQADEQPVHVRSDLYGVWTVVNESRSQTINAQLPGHAPPSHWLRLSPVFSLVAIGNTLYTYTIYSNMYLASSSTAFTQITTYPSDILSVTAVKTYICVTTAGGGLFLYEVKGSMLFASATMLAPTEAGSSSPSQLLSTLYPVAASSSHNAFVNALKAASLRFLSSTLVDVNYTIGCNAQGKLFYLDFGSIMGGQLLPLTTPLASLLAHVPTATDEVVCMHTRSLVNSTSSAKTKGLTVTLLFSSGDVIRGTLVFDTAVPDVTKLAWQNVRRLATIPLTAWNSTALLNLTALKARLHQIGTGEMVATWAEPKAEGSASYVIRRFLISCPDGEEATRSYQGMVADWSTDGADNIIMMQYPKDLKKITEVAQETYCSTDTGFYSHTQNTSLSYLDAKQSTLRNYSESQYADPVARPYFPNIGGLDDTYFADPASLLNNPEIGQSSRYGADRVLGIEANGTKVVYRRVASGVHQLLLVDQKSTSLSPIETFLTQGEIVAPTYSDGVLFYFTNTTGISKRICAMFIGDMLVRSISPNAMLSCTSISSVFQSSYFFSSLPSQSVIDSVTARRAKYASQTSPYFTQARYAELSLDLLDVLISAAVRVSANTDQYHVAIGNKLTSQLILFNVTIKYGNYEEGKPNAGLVSIKAIDGKAMPIANSRAPMCAAGTTADACYNAFADTRLFGLVGLSFVKGIVEGSKLQNILHVTEAFIVAGPMFSTMMLGRSKLLQVTPALDVTGYVVAESDGLLPMNFINSPSLVLAPTPVASIVPLPHTGSSVTLWIDVPQFKDRIIATISYSFKSKMIYAASVDYSKLARASDQEVHFIGTGSGLVAACAKGLPCSLLGCPLNQLYRAGVFGEDITGLRFPHLAPAFGSLSSWDAITIVSESLTSAALYLSLAVSSTSVTTGLFMKNNGPRLSKFTNISAPLFSSSSATFQLYMAGTFAYLADYCLLPVLATSAAPPRTRLYKSILSNLQVGNMIGGYGSCEHRQDLYLAPYTSFTNPKPMNQQLPMFNLSAMSFATPQYSGSAMNSLYYKHPQAAWVFIDFTNLASEYSETIFAGAIEPYEASASDAKASVSFYLDETYTRVPFRCVWNKSSARWMLPYSASFITVSPISGARVLSTLASIDGNNYPCLCDEGQAGLARDSHIINVANSTICNATRTTTTAPAIPETTAAPAIDPFSYCVLPVLKVRFVETEGAFAKVAASPAMSDTAESELPDRAPDASPTMSSFVSGAGGSTSSSAVEGVTLAISIDAQASLARYLTYLNASQGNATAISSKINMISPFALFQFDAPMPAPQPPMGGEGNNYTSPAGSRPPVNKMSSRILAASEDQNTIKQNILAASTSQITMMATALRFNSSSYAMVMAELLPAYLSSISQQGSTAATTAYSPYGVSEATTSSSHSTTPAERLRDHLAANPVMSTEILVHVVGKGQWSVYDDVDVTLQLAVEGLLGCVAGNDLGFQTDPNAPRILAHSKMIDVSTGTVFTRLSASSILSTTSTTAAPPTTTNGTPSSHLRGFQDQEEGSSASSSSNDSTTTTPTSSSTTVTVTVPGVKRAIAVEAVVAAQTISMASRGVASLAGSPSTISAAGRAAILLQLSQCEYTDYSPLEIAQSPTQMGFGTASGYYYRGGVVGSVLLLFACCALHLLAAGIVFYYNKGFRSRGYPEGYKAALYRVHFPSFNLMPYMSLMPSIITTSIALLIHGNNDGTDIFLGLFGLVVSALVPLGCAYIVFSKSFTVREEAKTAPNEEKPNPIVVFFEGSEHWAEIPELVDDDDDILSGANAQRVEEFKTRYYFVFKDYFERVKWFILVEITIGVAAAVLDGARPRTDQGCSNVAYLNLIFAAIILVACAALRPYMSPFDFAYNVANDVILVLGAALTVAAMAVNDDDDELTLSTWAGVCGMVAMYLALAKSIADIILAIIFGVLCGGEENAANKNNFSLELVKDESLLGVRDAGEHVTQRPELLMEDSDIMPLPSKGVIQAKQTNGKPTKSKSKSARVKEVSSSLFEDGEDSASSISIAIDSDDEVDSKDAEAIKTARGGIITGIDDLALDELIGLGGTGGSSDLYVSASFPSAKKMSKSTSRSGAYKLATANKGFGATGPNANSGSHLSVPEIDQRPSDSESIEGSGGSKRMAKSPSNATEAEEEFLDI